MKAKEEAKKPQHTQIKTGELRVMGGLVTANIYLRLSHQV